jgi:DHA1 family tetracycline resistance protein-like MFS transporter
MARPSANPLIFIFVTRLIDSIGFSVVMPVLPRLLLTMGAHDLSQASRWAGLLLTVYAVMQFLCGPIIGNLSDQFGRRPVILGSLLAFGFDYFLMGFAPSVGWLFLGRAVAGMAGAVYVPANAYVADVTPPERRAHAFGLVSSAFGLGFILGPVAGGLLGELGPRAPFFAAAALAGLNLLFGLYVLPESLPPSRRRPFAWRRANPLGALNALRRHPEVFALATVTLIYLIAANAYSSTWTFSMAAKFGWSPRMIGLSLGATGLGMATVRAFVTGRLVARIGERRTAIFGLSWGVLAGTAFALVPVGWMVFPLALVAALEAVTYPSLNAMMTRRAPPEQQGELQGAIASLTSLASMFGPTLMTRAFAGFSTRGHGLFFPGAPFALTAVLDAIGLATLLWISARAGEVVVLRRTARPSPSP